ncbi:MAG TPA: RsmB/NOP family class I SAM-dependent RNA methyltransferase [Allosphingosinicella sp.]|uniref:RsmB/NOP family class I SAM-dependent RNA methyltransferase n=1 Tax=Allosphingosinicella sp. TaxID=2823234 RepID=UPI002F27C041
MTPAARAQAAIELLDQVIEAARSGGAAADTLIARYFKDRRYAGSKDRRAVRELVYAAIRRSGERPASGRAALLGLADELPDLLDCFDGSPHAPSPRVPGENGTARTAVPAWLAARFDPVIDEAEWPALLERAPLDLRCNRLKGDREAAMTALPDAVATRLSPIGLRVPEGVRVEDSDAWRSGLVEVQDEGSQLLALACEARAGMTVVDLCAGAGGKTLALAAEMANQGSIVAADTDRGRLSRMMPRLERAGVSIVGTRLLNPGAEREALADLRGAVDLVLVDAPCSGSGTWRRNPETRWRLTPDRLGRLVALQAALLDIAAELVRPGGLLVYAVCSLLAEEGRNQAARFREHRSAWVSDPAAMGAGRTAGTGQILTPAQDGTDGFFVARWRAPC